jgi:hypothetical protein
MTKGDFLEAAWSIIERGCGRSMPWNVRAVPGTVHAELGRAVCIERGEHPGPTSSPCPSCELAPMRRWYEKAIPELVDLDDDDEIDAIALIDKYVPSEVEESLRLTQGGWVR